MSEPEALRDSLTKKAMDMRYWSGRDIDEAIELEKRAAILRAESRFKLDMCIWIQDKLRELPE